MKICFVNNAKLLGGAEYHLIDLAKYFTNQGIDLFFLTRDKSQFKDKLNELGYKNYGCFFDGWKRLKSFSLIHSILKKEKPDIVSINREHTLNLIFPFIKFFKTFYNKNLKSVIVFHTPTGKWYPLAKYLDGIVCTSRYTYNSFVSKNPFFKNKSKIIHYGIEIESFPNSYNKNNEKKYFKGRKFPIIAMIGSLWKNQEELIRITPILKKEFPDITVALIGSGSEQEIEKFKNLAEEFGVFDNVFITGAVKREILFNEIYPDLDLAVSTHKNEGFGIVHIESLASFVPVVAYNSGGLVEILDKIPYSLVDGNEYKLAERIIMVLKNKDLKDIMAEKGREIVEQYFTIDKMCNNHLEYYKKFFEGKNG